MYIYMYICVYIHIYVYIYIHTNLILEVSQNFRTRMTLLEILTGLVLDMSQDWLNTKKAADIGLRHMEKAELKDDDAKGKFHYRKGASVKGDDLFFSPIFNKGHVVDLNVNLL